MSRFILPYQRVDDSNGHPLDGAKLFFYEEGTSTPKNTYSDEDFVTPNENPVIADSQGQFGDIFLDGVYRTELKDKNDVTQPDYPADGVGEDVNILKDKELIADSILFIDETDVTKKMQFDVSGTSTGTTRILTVQDEDQVLVGRATTDTLENKTTTDLILNGTNTVNGTVTGTAIKDEDDMASDSAVHLATQQSIKAYVDSIGVAQQVNVQDGEVATGTTTSPDDDTIPQNTEGNEFITLAITPINASNKLVIEAQALVAHPSAGLMTIALFQDSTANTLAAMAYHHSHADAERPISLRHEMVAGTTSLTTFKIRVGSATAGTITFNGTGGSRILGGKLASHISITEVKA